MDDTGMRKTDPNHLTDWNFLFCSCVIAKRVNFFNIYNYNWRILIIGLEN